jgi:hypothetical protein
VLDILFRVVFSVRIVIPYALVCNNPNESYHMEAVITVNMNSILPAPVLILLATMSMIVAAETNSPTEFNAVYDVYRSGMKVAKMQRSISIKDDGDLLYHSETNLTGIASFVRKDKIIEQSVWQLEEERIIPLEYVYQHTGIKQERNVVVTFDWEDMQITNSVNGSSWKMPAEEGVLDKLLYQYSIMQEMKAGKTRFTYLIADGGKEKLYKFEAVGEEVIETPLGNLRTIKVVRHREDTDRKSTFWSAADYDYLPVKLENIDDGVKTVVMINSLTGLNYDHRLTQK